MQYRIPWIFVVGRLQYQLFRGAFDAFRSRPIALSVLCRTGNYPPYKCIIKPKYYFPFRLSLGSMVIKARPALFPRPEDRICARICCSLSIDVRSHPLKIRSALRFADLLDLDVRSHLLKQQFEPLLIHTGSIAVWWRSSWSQPISIYRILYTSPLEVVCFSITSHFLNSSWRLWCKA